MAKNRFKYLMIAIVVVVAIVIAASLVQLYRMNSTATDVVNEAMGSYQCSKAETALHRVQINEYQIATSNSVDDISKAQKDIPTNSDSIKAALTELDKISANFTPEAISAYATDYNALNSFISSANELASMDISTSEDDSSV